MGITTDFVIAEASEAKAVLAEPAPTRRWPGVEANSIDTIRLSSLASILTGRALDGDTVFAYSEKFTFLESTGDNERHVLLLPDEFVNRLASLKDNEIPGYAKTWLRTDEFRADGGWTEVEVREVLRELRNLASEAIRQNKPVLLQWSL
jgi:hypothetical protein